MPHDPQCDVLCPVVGLLLNTFVRSSAGQHYEVCVCVWCVCVCGVCVCVCVCLWCVYVGGVCVWGVCVCVGR